MSKKGRPTKYSNKICGVVNHYTDDCIEKNKFPTIEGLARHLSVGTRTIYDWETIHTEFSQTLGILRDAQRQLLITNGLTGKFNTRFSIFLLKASHGMQEKEPLINATQNSFMGITPDLLADALERMENKD